MVPEDIDTDHPAIVFTRGERHRLDCDFIAGCDGFHGVCRPAIPDGVLTVFDREYPFGWLGVLAAVPPSTQELIYAHSDRGFALHSMRGPDLSRFYLQVEPDEDLDKWPDERFWDELRARLETVPGWRLQTGPVLERVMAPMRSFVAEPMKYGRLYLAGDAAHIVPPTGAKGLNLAAFDVGVLTEALAAWYADGSTALLDDYSGHLPAPGLAGAALLLVDDHAAAHVRRPRRLRPPAAAIPPGVRVQLAGRRHLAGRELRGAGACLTPAACSRGFSPAAGWTRARPPGCRPCWTPRPRWPARWNGPGWRPRARAPRSPRPRWRATSIPASSAGRPR